MFYFQLAIEEIDYAVYNKLIAPFKNDLPTSTSDGFRRVCADHKYAFFGPDFLKETYSLSLPCRVVPLPETSYEAPCGFVISKNSSYKGLINWRWDNKMNSIKYMTDNSRICVPQNSPNKKRSCFSIIRHKEFNNRNVGKFCNISQNCCFLMEVIVNS